MCFSAFITHFHLILVIYSKNILINIFFLFKMFVYFVIWFRAAVKMKYTIIMWLATFNRFSGEMGLLQYKFDMRFSFYHWILTWYMREIRIFSLLWIRSYLCKIVYLVMRLTIDYPICYDDMIYKNENTFSHHPFLLS